MLPEKLAPDAKGRCGVFSYWDDARGSRRLVSEDAVGGPKTIQLHKGGWRRRMGHGQIAIAVSCISESLLELVPSRGAFCTHDCWPVV